MIDFDVLESEIKKNKIENAYIFCGLDEELIKEGIDIILNKTIDKSFVDLNYIRLDGSTTSVEDIINASETMPFMGNKKVVVVYRASFLKDKTDSQNTKIYNELLKYLKDMPSHTTLIMYYLFDDKRDNARKNKKIKELDKTCKVVLFDRLKKDRYYKKIEEVFKERKVQIGKIESRYFAEKVLNNFDVIKREADKVISYTNGREITRGDIDKLIANSSEDDIFDLVDLISQRKAERAIDLLDELLFKNDQHMLVVINIQNNFKRLYEIKILLKEGYDIDSIASKYKLPQFAAQKLINQCNKFSLNQLQRLVRICLETEMKLKSSSLDKTVELELMLFNIFMLK